MTSRIWPLMHRSLRTDVREIRAHLFRVALPAVFIFTLILTQWNRNLPSAPGRELFSWLVFYNYVFINLAAATFFASSISEEQEAGTLGLLRMADVSPLALILGKWWPRFFGAVLLLLLQFPFTLLCVTMGGVTWLQITATLVCLLSHLILVAGMALLCSVACKDSGRACGWTFVSVVLLHLVVTLLWRLDVQFVWGLQPYLMLLGHARLTGEILSSSFEGPVLAPQVWVNFAAGLLLMGVAWGVFDWWTQAAELGTVGRRTWRWYLRGKSQRAWSTAPIVWLGFRQTAGGWRWLAIRWLGYLGFVCSWFLWNFSLGIGTLPWRSLGDFFMMTGVLGILADVAYLSAQVLRQEVAGQTWGTLCTLPESMPRLAYSRVFGVLPALSPALTCCLLGGVVYTTQLRLHEIDECFAITVFFTGVICLGGHLTTLFSVSLDWSAWPISILLAVACCAIYFACTFAMAPSPNTAGIIIVCCMGLLAMAGSAALQMVIGQKLLQRQAE